jgi:uncharacterized protein DUF3592
VKTTKALWRILAAVLATVAIVVLIPFVHRVGDCGLSPVYARGIITRMEPAPLIAERDPHSSVPDYHLANRPVVRLKTEGGREAVAEPERAPASYSIGDPVAVCYNPKTPQRVYILGPANAAKAD